MSCSASPTASEGGGGDALRARSLRAARRCVLGALVVLCVLACAPETPREVDPADIPIADADVLVHVRTAGYGVRESDVWECRIAGDGRFRVTSDQPSRNVFMRAGGRTGRPPQDLVAALSELGFFELDHDTLWKKTLETLRSASPAINVHYGSYRCEVRRDGESHAIDFGFARGFGEHFAHVPEIARAAACVQALDEFLDQCIRDRSR